MNLLDQLAPRRAPREGERGFVQALRPIDRAFVHALRRLDPDASPEVLAAAALASLAVSAGHAAFDPAEPQVLVGGDVDWPPAADWLRAIAAWPRVAQPASPDEETPADAPLVLEHGLLYLRRYREYERRLAAALRRIASVGAAKAAIPANTTPVGAAAAATLTGVQAIDHLGSLAPLFRQLFPDAPSAQDRQARAAALALRHKLLLVTGGPGTGKTTTITRMLVLLSAQAVQAGAPALRIALAAPTGRAAERMAESVRQALRLLGDAGIDPALFAALPSTGATLHRLLGVHPDSPRVRHDGDNPLPYDIVVVDEASMIDLPLMAKLAEAVADGARLVLIGDPDQLPSVEAGDVLSGILRAAGAGNALAPDDAQALAPLLGAPADGAAADTAAADEAGAAFPGRRVHLVRGYRQSDSLQLAPLAEAVRDSGDPARRGEAIALLRGGTLDNVHWHEGLADPLQAHGARLLAHWRALAEAASPAEALALANRLRILTAVREGPQGARTLNARIEALLTGQRRGAGHYFHGQLLLVTENNVQERLFNGDIGVCFRDARGTVMAWFPGDDPARPRAFHPAGLPAHDSAFAMTVHKAQGSEFDEVWLLMPARVNRVLTRELVYTGITRARKVLHVAGSAEVMDEALARHAKRWSGLGWRLQDGRDIGKGRDG